MVKAQDWEVLGSNPHWYNFKKIKFRGCGWVGVVTQLYVTFFNQVYFFNRVGSFLIFPLTPIVHICVHLVFYGIIQKWPLYLDFVIFFVFLSFTVICNGQLFLNNQSFLWIDRVKSKDEETRENFHSSQQWDLSATNYKSWMWVL